MKVALAVVLPLEASAQSHTGHYIAPAPTYQPAPIVAPVPPPTPAPAPQWWNTANAHYGGATPAEAWGYNRSSAPSHGSVQQHANEALQQIQQNSQQQRQTLQQLGDQTAAAVGQAVENSYRNNSYNNNNYPVPDQESRADTGTREPIPDNRGYKNPPAAQEPVTPRATDTARVEEQTRLKDMRSSGLLLTSSGSSDIEKWAEQLLDGNIGLLFGNGKNAAEVQKATGAASDMSELTEALGDIIDGKRPGMFERVEEFKKFTDQMSQVGETTLNAVQLAADGNYDQAGKIVDAILPDVQSKIRETTGNMSPEIKAVLKSQDLVELMSQ